MDPVSTAFGVSSIVAPTLHCVRLLYQDVTNIIDAPRDVNLLKEDLLGINHALASLQAVSDQQWESLGDAMATQSKSAMDRCADSCTRLRDAISRWTKHSDEGKLSFRDRTTIGFFKQGQIKSTSAQLQNCRNTLISVASIATLHSSLQQKHATAEVMTMVSTKEDEIKAVLVATDKQLADIDSKLGALCLPRQDEGETEVDRASAISQVAVEKTALSESRKLLEELLAGAQAAAANARGDQARIVTTFGNQNEGVQIGVSHGAISNLTFGRRERDQSRLE